MSAIKESMAETSKTQPIRLLCLGVAILAVVGLVACGEKKDEKKAATQAAARVNKEELTVHQINQVLSQQRGLRQEQAEAAGKQVLERLIDQELAIQKAAAQKLDRDPRVVAQIDAARREIIARAYLEKLGEGATKPSAEEIKKYYDANPDLFSARKVYQFQELAVQAAAGQLDELRARLKSSKNLTEFAQYLQSNGIKFAANQSTRPAEQIPMTSLGTFAKMKEGDSVVTPTPTGALVVYLAGVRPQPVDEVQARPAIEQFLLNERKRKLIADDLKAMRAAADIKYLGKYAEGAPVAAPIAPAPTPSEVAASAAKALDESAVKSGFGLKDAPASSARTAAPLAEPAAPSASSIDTKTINKGLGLK